MSSRKRIRSSAPTTITGGGEVIIIEVPTDNTRDVSFDDTIDFGDQLAATLGPVVTPDSIDFGDTFVASDMFFDDSFDMSDIQETIYFTVDESLDISDRLSGTLGPVVAPDSIDFGDAFVAKDLFMDDSVDYSDQLQAILGPQFLESIDVSDAMSAVIGPITLEDSIDISDQLAATLGPVVTPDSIDYSDQLQDIFVDNFDDSFDVTDKLAGTLGPVVGQDSFDLGDSFVADDLTMQESIDYSDQLQEFVGPFIGDSIDYSDILQPILGPTFDDSFDVTDVMAAESEVRFPDSLDVNDLQTLDALDVTSTDSFDMSDELSQIIKVADDTIDYSDQLQAIILNNFLDSMDISDQFVASNLSFGDSIDYSDQLRPIEGVVFGDSIDYSDTFQPVFVNLFEEFDMSDKFGGDNLTVDFQDSLDFSDTHIPPVVDTTHPDSIDIGDALKPIIFNTQDSLDIPDAIPSASISFTNYANTIVTQSPAQATGLVWTNPNNAIDTSDATFASFRVTQQPGSLLSSGSNRSATLNFVLSFSNPQTTDFSFLTDALLSSVRMTNASPSLLGGTSPSCNLNVQYSLNDGGSWTTIRNITAISGTFNDNVDLNALPATWTQLQQLRWRVNGTMNSGVKAALLDNDNWLQIDFFYAKNTVTAERNPW